MQLYRGTSALPRHRAVRGHAWTWDRDVACWFAMRFHKDNGKAMVLSATVAREKVALFTDERGEKEAVVFGGCPGAVVDGTEADWVEGHNRQAEVIKSRNTASLEAC